MSYKNARNLYGSLGLAYGVATAIVTAAVGNPSIVAVNFITILFIFWCIITVAVFFGMMLDREVAAIEMISVIIAYFLVFNGDDVSISIGAPMDVGDAIVKANWICIGALSLIQVSDLVIGVLVWLRIKKKV